MSEKIILIVEATRCNGEKEKFDAVSISVKDTGWVCVDEKGEETFYPKESYDRVLAISFIPFAP
jgi:hypothetical protein